MKHPVTWYVLADGARARIVTRPESESHYHIIFAEDAAAAHARTRDLVSDRPGHGQESAYSGRHAIEPRHDAHRLEENRFLRSVAAHLNREATLGSFDRLVIYAAPRSLAVLRTSLEPQAAKRIHGEYAKDLTKVPVEALPEHFGTR